MNRKPLLSTLDLNLLVVFDAILKDRNITVAAQRVGLSQPAMSSALSRLRKTFGDPLFVRTGRGMQPTPYAQVLASPLQKACELVASSLEIGTAFNPVTSTRTFTFFMTDIGEVVLLPRLLGALETRAPDVRVKVLRVPERGAREAMAAGEVDIAVGLFPEFKAGFFQQRLYGDDFVCLASANHPQLAQMGQPRKFAQMRHAVATMAGTGHEAALEKAFAEARVRRRVVLDIPHFMAMPTIIAHTNYVVTVPRRLAMAVADYPHVSILEPPIPIPAFEIKQHWHERYHQDPASRWMRSLMAELFLE